jgi:hypothetical protein
MAEVTLDQLHGYEPGCKITVPTVFATGSEVGVFLGILPADDAAREARKRHPAVIVRNGDTVSYVRTRDMPKGALIHIDKRSAKRRRR